MKKKPKDEKFKTILRELQNDCPCNSYREKFKNAGDSTTKNVVHEKEVTYSRVTPTIKTFMYQPDQGQNASQSVLPDVSVRTLPYKVTTNAATNVISIVTDIRSKIYHSHSAIQISFNLEFPFVVCLDDEEFKLSFVIIPSDVSHKIINSKGKYLSILVDPLSPLGERINRLVENEKISKNLMYSFVNYVFSKIITLGDLALDNSLNEILSKLTEITYKFSNIDIDERIQEATRKCWEKGGKEISLTDLAGWVFLSKSRSQHLFKEEKGVAFSRYLKWIKTLEAIEYHRKSRSNLTEAAHMAGFSDSSHLTRTFKEMFCIPPSSFFKERVSA